MELSRLLNHGDDTGFPRTRQSISIASITSTSTSISSITSPPAAKHLPPAEHEARPPHPSRTSTTSTSSSQHSHSHSHFYPNTHARSFSHHRDSLHSLSPLEHALPVLSVSGSASNSDDSDSARSPQTPQHTHAHAHAHARRTSQQTFDKPSYYPHGARSFFPRPSIHVHQGRQGQLLPPVHSSFSYSYSSSDSLPMASSGSDYPEGGSPSSYMPYQDIQPYAGGQLPLLAQAQHQQVQQLLPHDQLLQQAQSLAQSQAQAPLRNYKAGATRKNSYPCPVAKQYNCSEYFTTSGHAARHAKKHTGKKDAICPECNKAFTRKDNMEQHRRTHAPGRANAKATSTAPASTSTDESKASRNKLKLAHQQNHAKKPSDQLSSHQSSLPPLDNEVPMAVMSAATISPIPDPASAADEALSLAALDPALRSPPSLSVPIVDPMTNPIYWTQSPFMPNMFSVGHGQAQGEPADADGDAGGPPSLPAVMPLGNGPESHYYRPGPAARSSSGSSSSSRGDAAEQAARAQARKSPSQTLDDLALAASQASADLEPR